LFQNIRPASVPHRARQSTQYMPPGTFRAVRTSKAAGCNAACRKEFVQRVEPTVLQICLLVNCNQVNDAAPEPGKAKAQFAIGRSDAAA
jgi:hypothetical protein